MLVGIAPLFIYEDSPGFRRLLLLGTGNSDYLDVIFHPRLGRDCAHLLFSEIEKRSALWEECNLERLRAQSLLLEGVPTNGNFSSAVFSQEPCPVIDLRARETAATAMLREARRYATKLRRRHSLSFEQATSASFDEFLKAWQRLHQKRWHEKGMPGVLTHANDDAFHSEVARRFLAARMLKLHCLRINGQIASAVYAFRHGARTYSYLTGFDPKYSRFSIGTVLVGHAIEQALEEGCDFFDFLKGREAHKYRWGASDQAIFSRTICKPRTK